jgi:8-oxo-dGTP pyrophosphatase MutT (NUDIX family)
VLCITPERQVVLVRQYRHGIRAASWELPAGTLEAGEPPLAGAQRELAEETGYESTSWLPLLRASLDPARQTAHAHFYCAQAAQRTRAPQLDSSEDIETRLVSRTELLGLIDSGELVHGIHIAAVLLAERRGLL